MFAEPKVTTSENYVEQHRNTEMMNVREDTHHQIKILSGTENGTEFLR